MSMKNNKGIIYIFAYFHCTPQVAIKTIKKSKIETEADLIRIQREIQIMSSVRHPNIIHIYEGELTIKLNFHFTKFPGEELKTHIVNLHFPPHPQFSRTGTRWSSSWNTRLEANYTTT